MVRAVLFDAAGTLIELTRSVGEIYSEVAADHGVALPAWRLDDAFGRVFRRQSPMCFPEVAPDAVTEMRERERAWWRDLVRQTFQATDSTVRFADLDALFETLWRHFADPQSWRLRPGVRDALAALRAAGIETGVVSNFDHRLPDLLQELGIYDEIRCTILPGTHGAAKPDPAVFEPALRALGVTAQEAVYVGDQPAVDGEAARAAGLRFIDVGQLGSLTELPMLLG